MIVPTYWAEARLQQPRAQGVRQITVRRFGWSDVSQSDAEERAQERARDALARLVAGETLPRSEPKVGYNGATGVPIREEILQRHGDTVITRNSYGAHCLNTPDVVFADIDFEGEPRARWLVAHFLALLVTATAASIWLRSGLVLFISAFLVLALTYPLAHLTRRTVRRLRGGAEMVAAGRIRAFAQKNPSWVLRLYRTPAGLRVLVMHDTFSPAEPAVRELFSALAVDPLYAKMCVNQDCFRARVSPKPWRIGIAAHLRPRPGVWPVKAGLLPLRQAWIRKYESAAAGYASCRFIEQIGQNRHHPKAEAVRILHDKLCRALWMQAIA